MDKKLEAAIAKNLLEDKTCENCNNKYTKSRPSKQSINTKLAGKAKNIVNYRYKSRIKNCH